MSLPGTPCLRRAVEVTATVGCVDVAYFQTRFREWPLLLYPRARAPRQCVHNAVPSPVQKKVLAPLPRDDRLALHDKFYSAETGQKNLRNALRMSVPEIFECAECRVEPRGRCRTACACRWFVSRMALR